MLVYVVFYSGSMYEISRILFAFYKEQDAIDYINNNQDYSKFCLEYREIEIK